MDNQEHIESNQKLISELTSTGLSAKAAAVYAALLELGGAFPSRLAEYTKLNRSTVYKVLDDLAVDELVNRIEKRKKFYYQINKPKKILHFAEKQVRISADRFEKAQRIIPELEGLFATSDYKPKVKFFEGLEGLLDIYKDHMDVATPYEMLAYGNPAGVTDFLPKDFLQNYVKRKSKIGITTRGIVPDTKSDLNYNDLVYKKNVKKEIIPDLRFVPAEIFPYKSEITIYGDNKVSIINFKQTSLIGVIIEDNDIHKMMQMIFELSWRGAKDYRK